MKKKYIAILLIFAAILIPAYASSETAEETEKKVKEELRSGIDDVLGDIDFSELEELYNSTQLSYSISFDDFIKQLTQQGLEDISFDDVFNILSDAFKKTLASGLLYMSEIVILLMLTGLLKNLTGSEKTDGSGKTAYFTGYIICAVISATILSVSMITAKKAIDDLSVAVNSISPILITLLTGLGSVSSSTVMSPVLAVLTGTVFGMIKNIVLPAITVSAILNLINNISSTVKFDRLCDLIASGIKWMMGIIFTVFLGISALKGVNGAAIDGVTFKTAKLTIDRTIPYIGGMFSDTLETMMACGLIAKNAVGTAGLIIIAVIMLYPLVSLIINIFLFKAGAAVVQPFADEGTVRMLSEMSKVVMLTFVTVLTCMLMTFILISLFIGAADIGFMMR